MERSSPGRARPYVPCVPFVAAVAKDSPVALEMEHAATLSLPRLTLRLLISYIYGAPSKATNANVVYIWTYVWQR